MQFNYNINPVDISAYWRGLESAQKREANDLLLQQQKVATKQQAALQPLIQAYLGGDASALNKIAAVDSGKAGELQKLVAAQAPKQAPQLTDAELISLGGAVKRVAMADPNAAPAVIQQITQQYPQLAGFGNSLIAEFQRDPAAGMQMLDRALMAGADEKPQEQTAQEKNFAKLQSLREQGRTEEADEFAKLINLKETQKLSTASEKSLIVSTDKYFDLQNAAGEAYTLAMQLEQIPFEGGVQGRMGETFRNLTGSQTAADELRKRFRAIRGSQVIKNLPPGAASDPDVKMALAGFPDDNWGSDKLQSYLRGMAKIAEIEADFHRYRAEYIGENNSSAGFISEWKKYAGDTYKKDNPMFRGNQQQLDAQRTLAEDEVRNMAKSKYGIDL